MSIPISSSQPYFDGLPFSPPSTPLDLTIFLNMNLDQLQSVVSTYDNNLLTSLLVQAKQKIYDDPTWLNQHHEKMRVLLDVLQKHAIKISASRLFNHQDLTSKFIDEYLSSFVRIFSEIQEKMGINFYLPMENRFYLSPLALLMNLPKHLISLLNPNALQESLLEISKNNNNCLYTPSDEVSIEYLKNLFFYLNQGIDLSHIIDPSYMLIHKDDSSIGIDLPPFLKKEISWMMKQPLFQNFTIDPDRFYTKYLNSLEEFKLKKLVTDYNFKPLERCKDYGFVFSDEEEINNFTFKINYLWKLTEILKNHPIFDTIKKFSDSIIKKKNLKTIEIINNPNQKKILFYNSHLTIYCDKKSTYFESVFFKLFDIKLNKITLFTLPSSFIVSEKSGKRKIGDGETKANKRLKTMAPSSSAAILNDNEAVSSNLETIQMNSFISKLPKSMKKIRVSDPTNNEGNCSKINILLDHFTHLDSLDLPIALFSANGIDSINFKNVDKLKITISSKVFELSNEEFEQQLSILKKIPFKKLTLEIESSKTLINTDRLLSIIQNSRNLWNIFIDKYDPSDNDNFYSSFFNIYYKIDQLELQDQLKLLDIFYLYENIIDVSKIDNKLQEHILNHFFSSYPAFPTGFPVRESYLIVAAGKKSEQKIYLSQINSGAFKFSEEFLKNTQKLKFLIQRFFDNPAFMEHFSAIGAQLLIAALEHKDSNYISSENDMEVDQEDVIPQEKLESILLKYFKLLEHNILGLHRSFSESPKLFNWMMSRKAFIEHIPAHAFVMGRLLIFSTQIYPQIEENWLKLLKLIIKYQILQNDRSLQILFNTSLFNQTPDVIHKILVNIQRGTPSEVDRNIKALLFLAPVFAEKLLESYDNKNCDVVELNKHLSLFLQNGWIPPTDDFLIQHPRFPFLLMDSLTQALPQLNELQKKWVSIIIPKIAMKPELTQREQENYMQLFNYHCIQKKRPFEVPFDSIFFDHYPYLFDQILSCYIGELASEPGFLHLGFQLTSIALSQQVEDDLNARKIVALLDGIVPHISNPDLKVKFLNLLSKTTCLPLLLKQAYIISKKGHPKLIKRSAKVILQALGRQNKLIPQELEYLVAHALLELKEVSAPLNTLQQLCTHFYDIVVKRKLKEVPKHILEVFFIDFEYQLKELAKNPDENLDKNIIIRGMNIIQLLFNCQDLPINKLPIFNNFKNDAPVLILKIITTIFDELMMSSEFIELVLKNNNSMLQFLRLGFNLQSTNSSFITLGFRCWKSLYFNKQIVSLFPMPGKEFTEKVLKYMVKYPDKFYANKEILKHDLLQKLNSIRAFNIPLDLVSNIVQLFLKDQDTTTLFWLGRSYPHEMKTLLGRELNNEELNQIKLCRYLLDCRALSSVQALIQKPAIPTQGNHSAENIASLLDVFNTINFSDGGAPNFCNPNDLKIDKKVVPVYEIKEYINRLIQNTLKAEKITAAPEDPVVRKQFYDEVHNYLKHISFLLKQKEPHKCVGYLLSLAEIGSKCATQYQEIPQILHCILQETDEVFFPCSIPFPMLKYNFHDYSLLIQRLQHEDYTNIVSQIDQLDTSLSQRDIYNKISITWLLAYVKRYGFSNKSLEKRIADEISHTLRGEESRIAKRIKNILFRLHCMTPEKTKEIVQEIVSINFENQDQLDESLGKIEIKVNQAAGLIQPQGLKDHLLIYLHDERWKYFRRELAKQPDFLEANVHNYKYIFQNVSKKLMIYEGHDCQTKYEDAHILPQAKQVPSKICNSFEINYNILKEFPGIKKFLQTRSAELTDWFKANAPEGKEPQQFLYEIYDEDFINIKDEWILYMLEKMNLVKK